MHVRQWPRCVVLIVGFAAVFISPVNAQTNERIYENIEFRVVTPGARAAAMGKTFVGIADDATAAASNPGGLSNLFDPEFSFEYAWTQLHHTRMATFDVTKVPKISTIEKWTWVQEPTFASFVTPLPEWARTVTVGFYYNSLQRYQEHVDIPNKDPKTGTSLTLGGYAGDADISGKAIGIAGSVLVHRKLSVGASIKWQRLHNRTTSGGFIQDFKPASYDDFRSRTETDDTDTAVGAQFGLLYKPTPRLALGAAFLPGTTFSLDTRIIGVYSPDDDEKRGFKHDHPLDVSYFKNPDQKIEYRIPDRFTVGVSSRLTRSVTAVGDLAFIRYSQRITEKFLIVDFLAQQGSSGLTPEQYSLPNIAEVHAGLEYRYRRGFRTVSFRAGFFTDPQHQMVFDQRHLNKSGQAQSQRIQFNTYQPGTAVGVTGGLGVVVKNHVQFDGAVSRSRNATEIVVSSVVRLAR